LATIQSRQITVTDLDTGQPVTISVPIEFEENDSLASLAFDRFATVLLTPLASIGGAFPAIGRPLDEVVDHYLSLVEQPDIVILEEAPHARRSEPNAGSNSPTPRR
jgi:hypothetical protein